MFHIRYEDYLQCPLQPLFDNLDCGTYEVFEKDPVKYRQYELAIISALEDKVPDSEIHSTTVKNQTIERLFRYVKENW